MRKLIYLLYEAYLRYRQDRHLRKNKSVLYLDACQAKILVDRISDALPHEEHIKHARLLVSTRGSLESIIQFCCDFPADMNYETHGSWEGKFEKALKGKTLDEFKHEQERKLKENVENREAGLF